MRVLIVDDQHSIRIVSSSIVSSMGHDTVEVSNGQDAIDLCEKEKIDLILMDAAMPDMDGFETTKRIRQLSSSWFPIIFLSAKTDPKFFAEGIKSGGDIYLYKPIVPEVLESMIHAMERIVNIQDELHGTKVKMELLAYQDELTGLVNRRGFDKALAIEFKHAKKEKSALSVLMIDVDNFKPFNDHYGHQAGDECLKVVAIVLKETACRPTDIVTRYGGEEFALILPNTNLAQAEIVGDRIIAAFKKLAYGHDYSSVENYITVSGGMAQLMDEAEPKAIVQKADTALYLAKKSGRNKILNISE